MPAVRGRGTVEYVPALRDGTRPKPYRMERERAEQLVARGTAYWSGDGTRRVYERSTRSRGDYREWRKTPSAGYAVMQLVPLGGPRRPQ